MRRKEDVFRVAAILLLFGVLAGEWAGVLRLPIAKANAARPGTFLLADGPAPVPGNPRLPHR